MSTLWTPDGERPIRRADPAPAEGPSSPVGGPLPPTDQVTGGEALDDEAQMAELRRQLAEAPVEVVIANHAFGLFELAALHLSLQPPQLVEARTAIDALGALVEGMEGRLGEPEAQLIQGLAQLRMAFVQFQRAASAAASATDADAENGATSD